MNNKIIITLALWVCMIAAACSDSHDGPEPTAKDPVRTVLVYMVANNSLGYDDFDNSDLTEMRQAALAGGLRNSRWLVYHHAYGQPAKLLELDATGTFKTLKVYTTDKSSVTVARMKETLDAMHRLAPAKSYGLVLWSHATGWLQNGIAESPGKQRSFGDDGGRYMNITSLAEALEDEHFDFIYADCCYMACAEVAYELRHAADYLVASAAELPANGMDYSVNMPMLTADTPNLVGAARSTFEMYAQHKENYNKNWCTMSVIDMRGMDHLARLTAELYQSATFNNRAEFQPFSSGRCYHYDLANFVESMLPADPMASLWHQALDQTVIYSATTPFIIGNVAVRTHCGLTTFILFNDNDRSTRNYNTLQWYSDVARHQPLP